MSKKSNFLLIIIIILLIIASYYTYTNYNDINTKFSNFKENISSLVSQCITKDNSEAPLSKNTATESIGMSDNDYLTPSTIATAASGVYQYYQMLSSNSQTLYKQLCTGIEKYQVTITPTTKINSSEVAKTFEAVFDDHPEYFWLDNNYSYKYDSTGNVVEITLNYNETLNYIDEAKAKFNNEANKIILAARKLDSDYKKEKYVHDAIITKANFNTEAPLNQSAYSALVNGETVCAGYARAFQYIMNKLDIPTTYVTGYAKEEHAWNIVILEYGTYNVDLTWDDRNGISYDYFNISDTIFSKTHTRTGLSLNLPKCESTIYSPNTYQDNQLTLPTYNSASPSN